MLRLKQLLRVRPSEAAIVIGPVTPNSSSARAAGLSHQPTARIWYLSLSAAMLETQRDQGARRAGRAMRAVGAELVLGTSGLLR
jgi:hypothetical protein